MEHGTFLGMPLPVVVAFVLLLLGLALLARQLYRLGAPHMLRPGAPAAPAPELAREGGCVALPEAG